MTKEHKDTINRLSKVYGGLAAIPLEVAAEALKLPMKDAQAILSHLQLPTEAPKKEKAAKAKPKTTQDSTVVNILRWVMGVIAPFALVLAGYFAMENLSRQAEPWVALFFSIIVIAFGTASFEVMILLKMKKKKLWLLFLSFFVVFLCFNLYNTVSSLSNRYLSELHSKNNNEIGISAFSIDIALLEQEKKTYENQIIAQEKLKIGAEGTLLQYDTPEEIQDNPLTYNNARKSLNDATKEITRLQSLSLESDRKKGGLLKAAAQAGVEIKVADTMNDIVARAMGVDVGLFTLVVQLIPAVLLDIVSVVCLYVFLYLQTITRRKQ